MIIFMVKVSSSPPPLPGEKEKDIYIKLRVKKPFGVFLRVL
jgi:hypothetical protein